MVRRVRKLILIHQWRAVGLQERCLCWGINDGAQAFKFASLRPAMVMHKTSSQARCLRCSWDSVPGGKISAQKRSCHVSFEYRVEYEGVRSSDRATDSISSFSWSCRCQAPRRSCYLIPFSTAISVQPWHGHAGRLLYNWRWSRITAALLRPGTARR